MNNIKKLTREMYYKALGKKEVKYTKFPPIPGLAGSDGEFYYYSVGDKNKLFIADPITEQVLIPQIYQDLDRVYGQIKSAASKLESSTDRDGIVTLKLPMWNWVVERVSGEVTYTMHEFKRICRLYDDYDGCHCSPGTYLLRETTGTGETVKIEVCSFKHPWGESLDSYMCFEDAVNNRLSVGEVGRLFEFYKTILFENGKEYYKEADLGGELNTSSV